MQSSSQGERRHDFVSQRKRMLQVLLNCIANRPILSNQRVFHRLFDGEASWVRYSRNPT